MKSEFSLEDYRWGRPPDSKGRRVEVAKKKTRQPGKFFFKGPVSLDWISCMASLPGKASNLGWLLWFMVGLRRRKIFRMEPKWYGFFGLNRKAIYRGLRAMEGAELISLKRKPGAAPEVTVLDARPNEVMTESVELAGGIRNNLKPKNSNSRKSHGGKS